MTVFMLKKFRDLVDKFIEREFGELEIAILANLMFLNEGTNPNRLDPLNFRRKIPSNPQHRTTSKRPHFQRSPCLFPIQFST